jgi:hypothetical protein
VQIAEKKALPSNLFGNIEENPSLDSQSSGWNLNLELPKYQAGLSILVKFSMSEISCTLSLYRWTIAGLYVSFLFE